MTENLRDAADDRARLREQVRARYAGAATAVKAGARNENLLLEDACCVSSCCGAAPADRDTTQPAAEASCCDSSCCGVTAAATTTERSFGAGLYDAATTAGLPIEAVEASLGCGNPAAVAELREGERVLDLGSGGGIDVLLSAKRVGESGFAYGVDMTDEMLDLARENAAKAEATNVEFLKGAIEDVPLPDASVDVVISNCVINLSTDKDAVLRECHRVLRPGGRFAVSDIVMLREVPEQVRTLVALWTGCLAGALRDTAYLDKLTRAGFTDAEVTVTRRYTRADLEDLAEGLDPGQLPAGMTLAETVDALEGAFASAFVRAVKPDAARLGAATGER